MTYLKNILATVLITFGLLLVAQQVQAGVNNYKFTSFEADYYLKKNDKNTGAMQIHERLVAIFPAFDQNRGIERSIPLTYDGMPQDPQIISVTDENDQPWPYTTYKSNGQLVVSIGDAAEYVQGQQTYKLVYEVKNVITFYDDHDELFWDTNGTGWQQPFDTVEARFHIPNELGISLQNRYSCFSGGFGSTAQNCTVVAAPSSEGIIVTAMAENLLAGENLSTVMGFDKGTFQLDPTIVRKRVVNIAGLIGLPLIAAAFTWRRWATYGRDPAGRGYLTPQYEPPTDLSVVDADVILHERLNTKGLTAGIIELVTKGYIHITEQLKKRLLGKDTSDYTLKLVKVPENEPSALVQISTILFGSSMSIGQTLKLSDNSNKLYRETQKLMKSLPKELSKHGYFVVDPNKARSSFLGLSLLVAAIGGLVIWWINIYWLVGLGFVIAGFSVLLFVKAMPARTKKGVEALEYLKGLEEYIKLAEQDRLAFHQSVKGARQSRSELDTAEFKIHLFEQLLPYAMLFGLEKTWAKQFENLYDQPPEWYSGHSGFNAAYFAGSLHNFESSMNSTFTPPSSSGAGGGSSGFSGGSSGGGGGGGGGGGW